MFTDNNDSRPFLLKILIGLVGVGFSIYYVCIEPVILILYKLFYQNNNTMNDINDDILCSLDKMREYSNNNDTLIAFSYAGMLWSYYIGVIAFLRDHFNLDTSNIKLSGISCGCSAVMTIFFDLTIEQAFEFGMEWQHLFDNRLLKCWFLNTSEVLHMVYNVFKSMNINDNSIKKQYNKYGKNAFTFGSTGIKIFPPKIKELHFNDFNTLKEVCYGATCSMRTLPFFYKPGYYNGYYCVDGALTSRFTIPNGFNNNNSIKISTMAFNNISDDINPEYNFMPNEWLTSGTLNDNLNRFELGYRDSAKIINVIKCIKKGLYWETNNNELNNHKIFSNLVNNNIDMEIWDKHINNNINSWKNKINKYFSVNI